MDEELTLAVRLARRAGDEVLRLFSGAVDVTEKPGGEGPVTVADRRSDALIREGLQSAFPGDAVLSEETPDDLARLSAERLWLVDPLDGTRQYVKGIEEFAVMIGLAVDGEPTVGVVHLPAERLTYAGIVGAGAFEENDRTGARRRLELAPWSATGAGPVVALSRFNASSRTWRVAEQLFPGHVVQSGSVGRKAMLVASGRADAYVTTGRRSRHWDACAPDAVVTAAGGSFRDGEGGRLSYNTRETRNDRGLFACRPGLEPLIEGALAGAWEGR